MAIIENTILGNQAANRAEALPLIENELLKVEKSTYDALKASPIPKLTPVPPLTLREDSDTPIRVKINAAKGIENRL